MSQVITDNRQLQRVSPSILLETDSDKNDTCIGAAILQLTDCPTPATPLDPIRESEVTLPLQPKGSIQLAMSFSRGFDREFVLNFGLVDNYEVKIKLHRALIE